MVKDYLAEMDASGNDDADADDVAGAGEVDGSSIAGGVDGAGSADGSHSAQEGVPLQVPTGIEAVDRPRRASEKNV